MKLAFALINYFPHGGLTRDLVAIARACQQQGHQVRVYAGECRGTVDAEIDLRLLPVKAWTNHGKKREFARLLKDATLEFSPDLVVGFNKMPALDIYYVADVCFAEKIHSRSLLYRIMPRCRHYLAFEKAVFSRESPTEIFMISKRQMNIYQDFYGSLQERVSILPPGISRDRIAGDDAQVRRKCFRDQWRLGDNDKLLLAVGSGFRTKGLDRTLKALASLPSHLLDKAHLFVVGKDRTSSFERLARRLGVRSKVKFLNGRDDVPEFLLGADLLIHPAYRENTGTVLLEAMVAGLPVITTDVCGYAHYISDENMGEVLASPFDQSALNQGVRRLIEMERNIWRERGRNFAQKADIYDMPLHACRRIEAIAEHAIRQPGQSQIS